MNTGQMLAVLVALSLLGVVSLTNNTMMLSKSETMLSAEASLNAISIAQTLIDEIMTKNYDLATITKKVVNANDFTASGSLGPNETEKKNVPLPDAASPYRSIKYYNDIDDYHGYRRIVSTPRMGDFTLLVSVFYVSEIYPDQTSAAQTFHKKIVVTVSHLNLSEPLQLSDISVYRRYF
ncbi:MAG: hypothetical protein HYZ34_11370 [Ignavibacteriae bacterium]|nr:hypothetical protein [Ignavibacteriota bacterium]